MGKISSSFRDIENHLGTLVFLTRDRGGSDMVHVPHNLLPVRQAEFVTRNERRDQEFWHMRSEAVSRMHDKSVLIDRSANLNPL